MGLMLSGSKLGLDHALEHDVLAIYCSPNDLWENRSKNGFHIRHLGYQHCFTNESTLRFKEKITCLELHGKRQYQYLEF